MPSVFCLKIHYNDMIFSCSICIYLNNDIMNVVRYYSVTEHDRDIAQILCGSVSITGLHGFMHLCIVMCCVCLCPLFSRCLSCLALVSHRY